MSKELIIPVFIPHLGCRHRCVFCNQRKISGHESMPQAEEIEKQVLNYRASCRDLNLREVQLAYYGGSFTAIAADEQEKYLKAAFALKEKGLIAKIRLSTRCDYIDDEVIARLKRYQVDIVELGVQSLDEQVLMLSQRGHTAAQVREAAEILKQSGFTLGLQMMIALPGDTPAKSIQTAKEIVSLEPDFVRIYPTAIIKDTELALMWKNRQYQPWDWDVLIDTTAEAAEIFQAAHIPIIRIGLQAADNLTFERDLLGGGYHPALGEMVKARIMRRKIERTLAQMPQGAYEIYANVRQLSQIKGQKNVNTRYFAEKYQQRLYIYADERLLWDEIVIKPKI